MLVLISDMWHFVIGGVVSVAKFKTKLEAANALREVQSN